MNSPIVPDEYTLVQLIRICSARKKRRGIMPSPANQPTNQKSILIFIELKRRAVILSKSDALLVPPLK